jgi:predicted RNA binding protein YcfA (HicA-like mRNA interferase family)
VNRRRLLRRIESGAHANIRFGDFRDLIEGLGFELVRVRGDHFIYHHERVDENLNIQPLRGQAKLYQVRDLADYIREYNLKLEDER